MINETTIRARYAETDQMGIVYHANYFTWFEIGRTEFFRTFGLDYRELEEQGVLLPVIDVGCKYKISAKYDDEIIIKTKLIKVKGVRLEFNYEIYRKKDNILLAEGYTKHAFVDKELRPVNFRNKFKELWNELKESVEEI
ncbi:acyl-CoA thioesterase [Caldisalinibacter kiritimatiensis]|uniref:Thioesterase superfamily protein n=1 Tax=Caldisalinibacter kiritimatiensis TaxID=1304284 RepID=R1AW37_9FIRM|nr:thioesterase family protein [Caldisalinibacter kiritimatiensis]EOD00852.1 Thioesterase superfamily protein [Caldisalinibacter kiritimatiensis]